MSRSLSAYCRLETDIAKMCPTSIRCQHGGRVFTWFLAGEPVQSIAYDSFL
jgi:hypothetical protein